MNKAPKKVSDILKFANPVRLGRKVPHALIALGVVIFMYSNEEIAADNISFRQETSAVCPAQLQSASFSLDRDVATFSFESNQDAVEYKVSAAFDTFAAATDENVNELRPLAAQVAAEFAKIDVTDVHVRGNVGEKHLNVSMLLPDGKVLSIIQDSEIVPSGIAGYNLLEDRRVIESGILPLDELASHIAELQAALA